MRRIIMAFLAGLAVPFIYAYQQPAEVAEFGIKVAAFKAPYVVDGYQRDVVMQEAAFTPEPPAKPKGKGKR